MTIVREAKESDLGSILEIYNDIILHTTAVYNYDIHTLEMRREWFFLKQQQGLPVFVAEEEDAILGFSTIGPFRAWQAYKYSVENSIYVHHGYRGRGIANLLMPPLIEAATRLDMHTIIAGIDASNEVSVQLHKKFGFEQVACFKEVGYKFDRWLDLIFMQLLLNTPARPVAGNGGQ